MDSDKAWTEQITNSEYQMQIKEKGLYLSISWSCGYLFATIESTVERYVGPALLLLHGLPCS
jgi:hypothetical protein